MLTLPSEFNPQGLPVDENGEVLDNGQFTQKDCESLCPFPR